MNLKEILLKKKSIILKKWLNSILETYPADTKRFLKTQDNRFTNPVGHIISEETENLLSLLIERQDMDPERISPILDKIIRIRAVQDFSPSQAIVFIYRLKRVIKTELEKEIRENNLLEDLLIFLEKIDDVALISFDIYTRCRDNLYEIRVKQARNQVSGLLRRAGLISEVPECDPQ